MGRPHKDGVDYWNIDVDLFQDKKIRLIRGEFGVKGVYITILLLNEIYRTSGYYKEWDDDDCLLMSDSSGVAGECSPQLIAEVVQGLLRRSFFDKGVFERSHVLTSAGIQRRFLHMVGNSRESIPIIREYFLLDTSNREDVTEATLKRLVFIEVSGSGKAVTSTENPEDLKGKALKDSRGEDRTGEDRTGAGSAPPAPPPFADCPVLQEALDTWFRYKRERREQLKPTGEKMLIGRIRRSAEKYGAEAVAGVIRDSMANNYRGIVFDWLDRRQGGGYGRGHGGGGGPDPGEVPGEGPRTWAGLSTPLGDGV